MTWIPIEDRLPIEHQLDGSSQTRGLWVLDINKCQMMAYYDFVTKKWREIRFAKSNPILNEIIYWMLPPELPRGI